MGASSSEEGCGAQQQCSAPQYLVPDTQGWLLDGFCRLGQSPLLLSLPQTSARNVSSSLLPPGQTIWNCQQSAVVDPPRPQFHMAQYNRRRGRASDGRVCCFRPFLHKSCCLIDKISTSQRRCSFSEFSFTLPIHSPIVS